MRYILTIVGTNLCLYWIHEGIVYEQVVVQGRVGVSTGGGLNALRTGRVGDAYAQRQSGPIGYVSYCLLQLRSPRAAVAGSIRWRPRRSTLPSFPPPPSLAITSQHTFILEDG